MGLKVQAEYSFEPRSNTAASDRFGRERLLRYGPLALLALVAINVYVYVIAVAPDRFIFRPQDWMMYRELPERFPAGTVYGLGPGYQFIWSPLAAAILMLLLPIGIQAWFALHVAVLAFIRNPRLIALVLLSLPFWIDAALGNTFTFSAVAGVVALRGSRWGALAFLALCVILPRPVQLPLALWLLWRDRSLWRPFVAMVVVSIGFAVVTGYLDDWIVSLLPFTPYQQASTSNISPTRLLGFSWYAIGLPLGAWLTVKGRVGLAGLAISPYVFPQYLMVLLWDLRPSLWPLAGKQAPSRSQAHSTNVESAA